MTVNERIRDVRKSLGLNQTEFGERIAVKQGYLTNIENGLREVTEKILKLVCSEYHVNENWLRNGTGRMFVNENSIVDQIMAAHPNYDELDRHMLSAYLELPDAQRAAIKKYILSVAEHLQDESVTVFRVARGGDLPHEEKISPERLKKLKDTPGIDKI